MLLDEILAGRAVDGLATDRQLQLAGRRRDRAVDHFDSPEQRLSGQVAGGNFDHAGNLISFLGTWTISPSSNADQRYRAYQLLKALDKLPAALMNRVAYSHGGKICWEEDLEAQRKMRIRGPIYWGWADPKLHHRTHGEILDDGTLIDVQVRLSRTGLRRCSSAPMRRLEVLKRPLAGR